jgi:uncharacterized membrane protein
MWSASNKLMIFLTFCVCVWQLAAWYPRLPSPIPSHFDANGQIDGEMGKTSFYVLMGLVELMFLVGFPLLGMAMKYIPNSLINLPNKEFWLAPERRDATLATSTQYLRTIGWMTAWLMIGIFHLTAEVATGIRASINPEVYWIMGIYMAILSASIVWLCLKYRMPMTDPAARLQEMTKPNS